MKRERHGKIIELIGHYAIETQEELADKLNEAGRGMWWFRSIAAKWEKST